MIKGKLPRNAEKDKFNWSLSIVVHFRIRAGFKKLAQDSQSVTNQE